MKIKRLLKQLLCRHTHGTLVAIGWDGASICQCSKCGKYLEFPLKQPTEGGGDE